LVADPERGAEIVDLLDDRLHDFLFRHEDPAVTAALLEERIRRLLTPRQVTTREETGQLPWFIWSPYAHSRQPLLVIDPEHRIRYANQAANAQNIANIGRNFRIGESLYEIVPPVDRAGFSVRVDAALQGERWVVQKDVEVVDGKNTWHEYVYEPLRDPTGEIVGVALTILDIGYRKKTEARLQESEERFWTFFEHLPFGMTIANTSGDLIHVNPAFAEMLEYERDELEERNFRELTHEEDIDPSNEEFAEFVAGESDRLHIEKRYRTSEGEVVWCDVVAWPIHNPDGELRYLISLIVDISDRKALQRQLQQTEKMRAVGQLASGFSHEFNNLLMAISGFADAASQELPPESTARDDIDRIQELADRGGRLNRQLLTYSRRQASNPEELDLNSTIRDMLELIRRLLDDRIVIETDLDEQLSPVVADIAQIEQVLMNLTLNASDAMPEGGRLRLTTTTEELSPEEARRSATPPLPAGTYVLLRVADTGRGMDEETRERIFEPFFSTKEIGEGTGLGLSLVYGVVEQLGGSIDVDTAPGEGSTFSIYFPAAGNDSDSPGDERG
jgi:PAS domain S-box-containing protein